MADRRPLVLVNGVPAELPVTDTLLPRVQAASLDQIAGLNPTLDLDFANQVYRHYSPATGLREKALSDIVTFTRASTATYFDAKGILQTAASDAPRIDFDPVTGICQGILIEEARTNLLASSSDFSNAWWGKTGCHVDVSPIAAPDGTLTASRLISDLDTANFVFLNRSVTTVIDSSYSFSVFVRQGTAAKTMLYFSGSGQASVLVTWASGIASINAGTPTDAVTPTDIRFVLVGNGWYRLSFTAIASETTTQYRVYNSDFVSNVIGEYTDVWGAQVEASAPVSSFIYTTSAAATRAIDATSVSGTPFADFYRQSEGTVLYRANYDYGVDTLNSKAIRTFEFGNVSAPTRYFRSNKPSGVGALLLNVAVGVVSVYGANQIQLGAVNANTSYSVVMAMKSGDSAGQIGGLTLATNTAAFTPPAVILLEIGDAMSGHIKRLSYWPIRLQNTVLSQLVEI
jgi:hypothetical protein